MQLDDYISQTLWRMSELNKHGLYATIFAELYFLIGRLEDHDISHKTNDYYEKITQLKPLLTQVQQLAFD